MIKTLRNLFKQDKEKFAVPKSVQAVIPLKTMWEDGIFLVGTNTPKPLNLRTSIMPWRAVRTRKRCSSNTRSF